ncbi:hypothetical protein [Serratia fonticola]|nr:hypothetical protein [Serratia fonticola]MBP1001221.1 hypothetical protein [Serratia fonticola]MBP1011603.1 hypothetical protein [Serratia fonticola]MBP1016704.1 hypothetical protein [Serratia fonticola]NXZ86897.1 hypothetical protein [Serratia fonticola]
MTTLHDVPPLPTLVGTPQEVRIRLDSSKADQVIVVPIERSNARHADLMAHTLANIVSFIDLTLRGQSEQMIKALVDALVPKVPPTPSLLKEAAMVARSRKAVLESADWLTAAQVAELAGLSASNPSTQPNKWKRQKQIFAITHNGVDYFPGYGLDPDTGYRPRKGLKPVLDVFGEHKDGWGLAYWFLSANSFLGGKRPQDVLASEPERVIAAAEDEIKEINHG